MMLLLSVVFSVIQPFVLVCGLIYFAMSLVVESYNWGWVFRRPYEGGGVFWKQVGASGVEFGMEGREDGCRQGGAGFTEGGCVSSLSLPRRPCEGGGMVCEQVGDAI
jgi:hypothetical protein